MANSAYNDTLDYDYSETFSYGSWTENTQLSLVNVPWNSDYRDIVRFGSQALLDAYLNKHNPYQIEKMSLLKFNQNVRINVPLGRAMQYNYARAVNHSNPVGDVQQSYYYFVQDYRYISPNTTELILQLDVWQTFGYKVTFGRSFIERGHIGIANSHGFDDYGRDYLTVPEGMDIGGEYRTVHVESTPIVSPSDPNAYSILVCSSVELSAEPGLIDAPILTTAYGSILQGIPSGASFYIFQTASDFTQFMQIYAGLPWVTEGILSITIIPHVTRYHPTWTPGTNLASSVAVAGGTHFYAPPSTPPVPHSVQNMNNWRNAQFISDILGPYAILKKFLTYPYMVIEMTTFTGSPAVLKPESWQDANAQIQEQASFVPPGQRVVFYPHNYNSDAEAVATNGNSFSNDDLGDFINTSVSLDNFPQMAVVNNMAIAFLANNKNGIAFGYSSADWSQQKALHGAQATYDVANSEIGNTARQAGISNSAATELAHNRSSTAMTQMQANLEASAASLGASSGGIPILGVVTGARDAFNNISSANLDLQNTGRQVQARGESAASSIQASGQVRDTNVSLARFSAKGDYANAIAAVNAKVNDARMTQPSTSGQFGGDAFNLINGIYGYSLRFKMLNVNALKTIGNYWLRYGYAINQFAPIPTNFMVMSKFTYWKLSETYITAAPIPEMFKQAIRGIFEKGVTVWSNPDYIGTTDLTDNAPVNGAYY